MQLKSSDLKWNPNVIKSVKIVFSFFTETVQPISLSPGLQQVVSFTKLINHTRI